MALFELEELVSMVQQPKLPRSLLELIRDLTEDAIYGLPAVGSRITDPPQRGIKGIALEVARRALLNPANVQAESANGTSVTYGPSAGGRGVSLTNTEVKQLRSLVGLRRSGSIEVYDPGLGVLIQPPIGWPDKRWPR